MGRKTLGKKVYLKNLKVLKEVIVWDQILWEVAQLTLLRLPQARTWMFNTLSAVPTQPTI